MRFYISDLHLYHTRLLNDLDMRGFHNIEDMNEYIIQKWNSKVSDNDEVIILGDFSTGNGSQTNLVLNRLNGKKGLIIGNHDDYLNDESFDISLFDWIAPYKEIVDNKQRVVLSHYPVICYNGQQRFNQRENSKTYMLYGHVHNSNDEAFINYVQNVARTQKHPYSRNGEDKKAFCNMINCFCMFSDYTPLSLEEWIAVDTKRRKNIPRIIVA